MNTLQHNPPWSIWDRLRNQFNLAPVQYPPLEGVGGGKEDPTAGLLMRAKNVCLRRTLRGLPLLGIILINLLTLFLFAGAILQILDPAAGILDIGILSVLLLGIIGGLLAIFCSIWLQELLWQPFKVFRKQFNSHFNQLSAWQQCILYFSAFFLLLYAVLWGLAMVL